MTDAAAASVLACYLALLYECIPATILRLNNTFAGVSCKLVSNGIYTFLALRLQFPANTSIDGQELLWCVGSRSLVYVGSCCSLLAEQRERRC